MRIKDFNHEHYRYQHPRLQRRWFADIPERAPGSSGRPWWNGFAVALITIVPFIWMFISSFAPNSEIVKVTGGLFPKPETQLQYVGHLKPGIYIKAGRFVGLTR